jgi:hypothetical protein
MAVESVPSRSQFRGQHAYPLRMANANLRYYVRDCGGNVTQRLKKFPTILDKLDRLPAMQLANMEDIAGREPWFPTRKPPMRSPGDCARTGRSTGTATTSARRRSPATGRFI